MKKNGFTFVELLTTIIVLAIILAIAVPNINTAVNESKEDALNSIVKYIESSARLYVADNPLIFQELEGCSQDLTIETLKTAKLLDKSLENPVTKEQMPNETAIKVCNDNQKYTFELMYNK